MWKNALVRAARSFRPDVNFVNYSTSVRQLSGLIGQRLDDRSVLRVSGNDSAAFLQSLMTNDVRHLDENHSMYCMFLHSNGRILYDAIIYRGFNKGEFLIECDACGASPLLRHLSAYRVRRKVTIEPAGDLKVLFLPEEPSGSLGCSIICPDPRAIKELGWRAIVHSEAADSQSENLQEPSELYNSVRYRLGIGEGVSDLPPGTSFPLECNCDYLHGVSFHKGCYIGQELTARTYHTGVTRKRLMPLVFKNATSESLNINSNIVNSVGTNVGKLRGFLPGSSYGLALLRIQHVLPAGSNLLVEPDSPVETHRPSWWPIEAPKDRSPAERPS